MVITLEYHPLSLYTCAYIQDKFAFEDIVFNVGLRIDRYDANQEVLKDNTHISN